MRSFFFVAMSLFLLVACQSQPPSMSVDEARKITADFPAAVFVQPPRTIADVTAILDQQKPDDSFQAAVRVRFDEAPPTSANATQLAGFYFRRSLFALQAGMGQQAIAD